MINNTIVDNSVGVDVDNRVDYSADIFRNNIIANNGIGLEDDFGAGRQFPVWQNNLLFNNTTEYSGMPIRRELWAIFGDPRFVSSTDFHLTSSSPAIANGSSLLAPSVDFEELHAPRTAST